MHRFIQEHIKKPLVDEVLFGKLEFGGAIRVDMKDDKPEFRFEASNRKQKLRKEDAHAENA
jgi:ATP-dependent Clp protease ATP-binding subunit ClpA